MRVTTATARLLLCSSIVAFVSPVAAKAVAADGAQSTPQETTEPTGSLLGHGEPGQPAAETGAPVADIGRAPISPDPQTASSPPTALSAGFAALLGDAGGADIIVTGSRIARTTFETPTPVTAVTQKQLDAKAATTVVDLLRDVPALRPNQVQGSGRNIGVSTFNMRSLGATRTLVLLDGQRLMDTSPVLQAFDISIIPAPLISRVEIVTAGASSVYGSDAVTGVVNVILNNNLLGGRIDVQGDISTYGDQKTATASLAYGTKFANDRGKLVVAASFLDRPDILYQGERPWGRNGYVLVPNAAYTTTNGQYRQLIQANSQLSQMTLGGVITTNNAAVKNIQFGPGGVQSPFVQGTNVGTVWMQGGGGLAPEADYGVLIPSIRQGSVFARATYELTDNIEARFDVLGAQTRARSTNNFNYNNADITVRRDNPYLPANILALMVANNLQTITLGRLNTELGLNTNTTRNHYLRTGGGLKGKLFADWTWEVGGSYSRALSSNEGRNNRNNINWNQALDVTTGPNGAPVCRTTLANPANGCVPANIFGTGSLSQAAINYATGTSLQRSFSHTITANADVAGALGQTWAGPIKLALGLGYRRDQVNSVSDPISDLNGWRQGTFASYRGKQNVKEVYGEASVPLARDGPLLRSLDLDLAGRYVDYSVSGNSFVWKTGLNWALNRSIRLRGTYSKDFRAPKIDDLFSASSLRAGNTVLDFQNNRAANVNTLAGGNRLLKPEVAHTLTGGVILQPEFIPGLQLSADYFNIKLKNAITVPTAQEVVNRCGLGDATFCAGITRDPTTGLITTVQVTTFNSQTLKTHGVDVEGSYQFPLFAGDFNIRTVGTYTPTLTTSSGGAAVNTAGQLQGTYATPKWRVATTLLYTQGPLTLRALFNYVGPGTYDNTYGPLDLDRNHYPAYLFTDISAQYDLTKNLQIYAKVENLLNTAPPLLAANTITIALSSVSQFHDLRGRNFGLGARLRW